MEINSLQELLDFFYGIENIPPHFLKIIKGPVVKINAKLKINEDSFIIVAYYPHKFELHET